jgi:hypothetical protein
MLRPHHCKQFNQRQNMNAQRISPRDRARYGMATHPRLGLIAAIVILLLLMASLLLASPLHAQEPPPSIATDRPGQATPPTIAPPGYVQLELGFQLVSDAADGGGATTRTLSTPQALIRVGLLPTMELRLQGELRAVTSTIDGGAGGSHDGLAGLAIGTKVGITGEQGAIPEMALGVTLGLPAGDSLYRPTSVAPSLYLAARNGLSSTLSLYYNIGAGWDGSNGAGSGIYALSLGESFSEEVSGFAEIYGTLATGAEPLHAVDAGVAWLAGSNLQLDLSAGAGLTPNAPDYFVSAGVSLRLPR